MRVRSRHLTRSRGSAVFQIRVPRALDPDSTLSPIRVTLPSDANSRAQRTAADMLAGLARTEFARIGNRAMSLSPAQTRHHVATTLAMALPTLLGLDTLARNALPAEIGGDAAEAVFDALARIGVERGARPDPAGGADRRGARRRERRSRPARPRAGFA
jgi:hypothetical protein